MTCEKNRMIEKMHQHFLYLRNPLRISSIEQKYDSYYYTKINRLVKEYAGGTVLAMGTHVGNDVKGLKDVTIVEPVKSFADEYKNITKATVINQGWENITLDRKFDTVLCLDCLEHSKEPEKIIKGLTKVSDFILISVPNPVFKMFDKNRKIDHGHGVHVSFLTADYIKSVFAKLEFSTVSIPIYKIGFIGVGVFVIARRKIRNG